MRKMKTAKADHAHLVEIASRFTEGSYLHVHYTGLAQRAKGKVACVTRWLEQLGSALDGITAAGRQNL